MKLDAARVRQLARHRSQTLTTLLRRAGVSRTAFYSLVRRPSVLPSTVHALAGELRVAPQDLLHTDSPSLDVRASRRVRRAKVICARHKGVLFENVWHTLVLLELTPLERLNRSLLRGRTGTANRQGNRVPSGSHA